jgi:hypothetical protein
MFFVSNDIIKSNMLKELIFMENDKIFELIERFYSEIESTKILFTEKVETKLNEIENKLTTQKQNNTFSNDTAIGNTSTDSFQKDISSKMDNFSEVFDDIHDTIGLQALTINNLTKICRVLMVITSISLIIALIVLFKS